ncbi:penicillin-binding transpeptidase domain-containing protein [Amycolatopsis sp. H20-H5]|uniref:penicillin-binding transpeptidase domain-containing protein n=1 Tax=Amycolatopsis sp. H20-H5 TaxID=3046309 RepID=UPI002DB7229C|nr:penicillin-binding transpeptidase domain-containing protein [Amycolatopsis sp. H20-H5]MEC3977693.1 penicillin-binding transpeptidase domain-containing protein [Amycolatopsis sp. H20-H5]
MGKLSPCANAALLGGERTVNPARRRAVLIGGALAVVAIVVAGLVLLRNDGNVPENTAQASDGSAGTTESPSSVALKYLEAFGTGDADAAGKFTDDPAAASAAIKDARAALVPTSITTSLAKVAPAATGQDKTSGSFTVSWVLGAKAKWTFDDTFDLKLTGRTWRLRWTPALIHPKLEAGQRLALTTTGDQPLVVDRDGKALVPAQGNPFPLLQSALTSQATGTAQTGGVSVSRVDDAGKNLETLFGGNGNGGGGDRKPLTSGLSLATQTAAQAALDGYQGSAMMVVIQPSSGDLLAVAQNAAAGTQLKALSGQYAPGSTFKIVTATAALEQGDVDPDTMLPCPGEATIGTRTIPNENKFDKGTIAMHSAFAYSCNTTFGALAAKLPSDGLAKAASQYGINADFEIPGLPTEAGKVEPAGGDEQVEDGIGQGTIQVSPFGGALMAATVAAGKAVTPKLWHGIDTQVNTGYKAPPASVLNALRPMMREVVTTGTAKGVAGSGQVFGKTGTAQFGSGEKANGWFVGYRGDVAFAIMLEASNDSKPAVTLAKTFLGGLK